MILENIFELINDNLLTYINPAFLFSIKNNFDSFFKYLFEYIDKSLNSEKLIYLEKKNLELKTKNLLLNNSIEDLTKSLNLLTEGIIDNFWFYLSITMLLIFNYYVLVLILKLYFKDLLNNNPILNYFIPNKYLKLKKCLNNLNVLVDNYNNNINISKDIFIKNNNVIKNNIKILGKKIDKIKDNYELKEKILRNYKLSTLNLKNHLDSRNEYVYNKTDVENISKFFIYQINTYNKLIFNSLAFSNAMFANFTEFLKLLKNYEDCREIVFSKYTPIRLLNFAGHSQYTTELELNTTYKLFSEVKNNDDILNNLNKFKQELKLNTQTSLKMITANRHFFLNKYFKFINKDEQNQLLTIHSRIDFHLKTFYEAYKGYVDNYKVLISYNEILKKDSLKITDKEYISYKTQNIKNTEINMLKPFAFKKEPKSKLEIAERAKDIKFYTELKIREVEYPFYLNKNSVYSELYEKITSTDLYEDTKLKDFEGSYEFIN